MTTPTHVYAGAVIANAMSRHFGLDAPVAAPVIGALLGSAPDTLDWAANKILHTVRYGPVYQFLHKNVWAIVVQCILIIPGFAHILPDLLLHEPVIPVEGFSSEYDTIMFRLPIFRTQIRRRDVHWLTGEIMLVALATLLLVLS